METPEEMTATCQRCGTRLTLPLPHAVGADGEELVRGVDLADTNARAWLREFLEAYPCPSCEYLSLRVPTA
jgi:hypothetical protein